MLLLLVLLLVLVLVLFEKPSWAWTAKHPALSKHRYVPLDSLPR
jgi:hypothetical protein